VECPQCGILGFLEVRGSSGRIKHYDGYVNGKRVYHYHNVPTEQLAQMGINVGIKTPKSRREAAEAPPIGLEQQTSGDITRKPNIFLALSYY